MKWIKYQVVQSTNGEETVLANKKVGYSNENLAIAQREAYNGYEIVDDEQSFEKEPLAIELGGTGAKTAEQARENIGAASKQYVDARVIIATDPNNDGNIVLQYGGVVEGGGGTGSVIPGGSTGEPGGYYTPSIDEDGTLIWTPSNPNMPSVESSYIADLIEDVYKKGTIISSDDDLDDYTTIGKYYANSNSVAANLKNCPTTQNFVMWVFVRTNSAPSQIIIDLTGKMFIRSRSSSVWNGWQTYLTNKNVSAIVQEELAKYGQIGPAFANSIAECTDTNKLYVLPDGYIYAYMAHEEYPFTNQIVLSIDTDNTVYNGFGYKSGYRINREGQEVEQSGDAVTGFIPIKAGDVLHFKNIEYRPGNEASGGYLAFYNGNFENIQAARAMDGLDSIGFVVDAYTTDEATGQLTSLTVRDKYNDGVSYFRISSPQLNNTSIITLNEEITGEPVVTYSWENTGHAFVPTDYEDRIIKAENDITTLKQAIAGDIAVYGMVDEENNIVMTGTLTPGKYSLRYMNEDGTTTDIGEFTMW